MISSAIHTRPKSNVDQPKRVSRDCVRTVLMSAGGLANITSQVALLVQIKFQTARPENELLKNSNPMAINEVKPWCRYCCTTSEPRKTLCHRCHARDWTGTAPNKLTTFTKYWGKCTTRRRIIHRPLSKARYTTETRNYNRRREDHP